HRPSEQRPLVRDPRRDQFARRALSRHRPGPDRRRLHLRHLQPPGRMVCARRRRVLVWGPGESARGPGSPVYLAQEDRRMPEVATTEFWKDIKPVPNSFKPGVLPEVYMKDPANRDERYFVPVSETVWSRPVWISPQRNMWADILMSKSAGLVNRHYHPHHIFAYTISGKWGYLEHDWTATKGDFVYETPGESHTLVCYETEEPMKVFFVVT